MSATKRYWRVGEPCVWGTATALAVTLLIAATLIVVVMINGLGVFWASPLLEYELKDGTTLMAELVKTEEASESNVKRYQLKIGNRDLYGLDFRWIDDDRIAKVRYPDEAYVLEREEYGNFYGFLEKIRLDGETYESAAEGGMSLHTALDKIEPQKERIEEIDEEIAALSYKMERIRRDLVELDYQNVPADDPERLALQRRQQVLQDNFGHAVARQTEMTSDLVKNKIVMQDAGGLTREIILADIVRAYQPNTMSLFDKIGLYLEKLVELFVGQPRESNTEGGLFPAIFGTVLLIFIMSLFSFPFGVLAAIYLREYARDGLIVRIVRIAVNNLAGIPSIVYGIFGLGFFIYGIGSTIDQIFFPEQLPTPTFGTGGILWASLTLALLTVPVVIVATEEALGAIPREIREGSLAVGATKFQTLYRILLPMASPGIMTGLILAMARAAGEVAPLMITGVVKLAPALPIDGNFPFVHLDRKFMHLGFHIYDIGFQSPNVEAAKPMVFVTTLLLVLIVLVMSSVAIRLRNKMKKRYTYSTF